MARILPREVALAAAAVCLSAQAADPSPEVHELAPVTVHAAGQTTLDEPASTGSNLGLTPMQTPASVDVIARDQLEIRGDVSLVDAITRAPGLSGLGHPGNGGASLSARGFTDAASVMRLYDGVRQYGGIGVTYPFDTWSVERIEVLRGPASVIYGEGAIGGVVNVVPKKPTRGPIENEIQATIGTENTQRLAFGSGGAIDERWSYRFDVSGNRTDGSVDFGDSRNLSVSGALQWDPTPELAIKLSYAKGWQQPARYFGVPLVNGRQDPSLRTRNYNVSDSRIQYDDQWTELSARWTPSANLTVRSRAYYIDSKRHWRNAEYYDYLPASGLIQRSSYVEILHDQWQVGNTTDVVYRHALFGMNNSLSVGFDINRASFRHTNNSPYSGSTVVDPYTFERGQFINVAGTAPRYSNEAVQYALFAENRLEITPRWSVLGGLRYDHARIERHDLMAHREAFDRTFSHVGWRAGTVYNLTPNLALYAQYSEAADPVSALLMLSSSNSNFDLSTGRQIEAGVKQDFWNGKGEWTVAAYHIVKKNLVTRDAANPAQSVQVGEQSSRGIEASVGVEFLPGWRLDANAALLQARYDDFTESVNGTAVSRADNVPTDVPERLANAWLTWRFLPEWTAGAGIRYVGRRFADRANTLEMPAYTTTDLLLQWRPRKNTTLSLRGFNVFDRHYVATAYYNPTQWLQGAGRRVELTVNHRF
ncbi:TonB-dependent receptor [Cupriavidus gilardii]|uniref:TonB-dependent receptor n=1 Tax=Cupriavidus gilardii TaxID=82541 RepID=UPI001BB2B7DF|nr:TonB-dependent receptor [Cupriavidus gilardii]MCT9015570.1 TonB-dependent receptor [Cupriavidus gilardii]MCT9055340.1 TonB-dependent receptor [Cupriavidus gilardii]MCT9118943.1 TonB-dependent receptor [Cupriavidus gilardii]WNG68953.1 TonB-dependent receptor [Cupriavidus gilardii]